MTLQFRHLGPALVAAIIVVALLQGHVRAEDAWFTPGAADPPVDAAEPAPDTVSIAPAGLSLDLPTPATLSAAPPRASKPPAVAAQSATASVSAPKATSGLRIDVGVGFTVPDTDNPPVGVSASILGADPTATPRIALADKNPYATPADARTPERAVGIGLTYALPPVDTTQISVSGTFARSRYSPLEKMDQNSGTATVRIQF